ncbi:hypothetical protein R6Q57_016428 [Mikania cordata]
MACNGTGCQSGCYKDSTGDQDEELSTEKKLAADANGDDNHGSRRMTCLKCKATEATVFTG